MKFTRRFLITLALAGLLTGGQAGASAQAPGGAGTASGPQPSAAVSAEGVILDWRAPQPQVVLLPEGRARLELPGYSLANQPGLPRLPFTSVLVTLPPGANPALELLLVEEETVLLPAPLEVAQRPQGVLFGPDGQVMGGAYAPVDTALPFDPEPVVFEELGVLRGVRLARLTFYPARPRGDDLLVTTRVQAQLRYNAPASTPLLQAAGADPLLRILQSRVINPQALQAVRGQPAAGEDARPAPLPETGRAFNTTQGSGLAVEVSQAGLTAITYEALAASGIPPEEVVPQQLQLSRAGVEVAAEWEGDEDEIFESGERLLFYARPRFSRWTANDVYFLNTAGPAGPLMASGPASPGGLPNGEARVEVTAEQNKLYTPNCLCAPVPAGRDGDRWVWDNLQRPGREAADYPVELPAADPGQPAQLDLWLIGSTEVEGAGPDHSVQVAFNGVVLGSAEWDGKESHHASFTIPGSAILGSANTLSLSLPGLNGVAVEGFWLDAFSVTYSRGSEIHGESLLFEGESEARAYTIGLDPGQGTRAYDVSDPDRPVRLEGFASDGTGAITLGDNGPGGSRQYYVTTEAGIRSPERLRPVSPLLNGEGYSGADYLVITPAEFAPALTGLIEQRQAQGLSAAVEQVEAIYDAFGEGRPDPEAIRAYLSRAYSGWALPPTYVLLVGDGTYDPRRYIASSTETFIPPYLAEVDPWAGETAADNRYVTLEGQDNLPEMLIGRLPVNSLEETQVVVDKILRYETTPPPGLWEHLAAFVADDADESGDFPSLSESIADSLVHPPQIALPLSYAKSEEGEQAHRFRERLVATWRQGLGLLTFTGHASVHQWAVELFFHAEDIPQLDNGTRLPVVVELTCFTASFHIPGSAALDEALLRHAQGGAAAVWGPTGLGLSNGHAALAEGFLSSLFQEGRAEIGAAALAGKLNLSVKSPSFSDLIDTFTLLGDPAMPYNLAPADFPSFLPQVLK